MDLKKINKVTGRKARSIVKLQDLPQNVPKRIFSARAVGTHFGRSIVLQLAEGIVFLPKRVTQIFEPHVLEFRTGKYGVCFRGTKDVKKENLLNKFEIVDLYRLDSKMLSDDIDTYDDYLQEAFDLCKKNFEATHPDKQVQLIQKLNWQITIEKPEVSYQLSGRADGLVHSSQQQIGIFRIWVLFSSFPSPAETQDFEDRIQLYLYLYNSSVAYVMEYVKDTKAIQNPREILRNDTRIDELLEEVSNTAGDLGSKMISVRKFLDNRNGLRFE